MTDLWAIFSAVIVSLPCGLSKKTKQPLQRRNDELFIAVITLDMATDLILAAWLVPTL
jgi:hypothetical protein